MLSLERRALSLSVALVALVVSAIPMLVIALLVRLSSPGPALFRQERVGRHGEIFQILKFRTMFHHHNGSATHTREDDDRITPLGRHLRRFKLDELPQLINVLRGDMALIGPRPKLYEHTEIRKMPYRPGLTGAATLAFRHEEKILRDVAPDDLDTFYVKRISPLKTKLDVCYMCRGNAVSDLRLLVGTALSLVAPRHALRSLRKVLGPIPVVSPRPASSRELAHVAGD